MGQNLQVKSTLASKLLKISLSYYLLIAVTVTCIHIIAEYIHVKEYVKEELVTFQKTIEPAIVNYVWNVNYRELKTFVAGVLENPIIVGVSILDDNKEIIVNRGIVLDKNNKAMIYDENGTSRPLDAENTFSELFYYKFTIYSEKSWPLGEVYLYSHAWSIFNIVKMGFLFIILNSIIKSIALCIIFYIIILKYLNRPLKILTIATQNLRFDNLKNYHIDIQQKDQNELKLLENTFNEMITNLDTSIEKSKKSEYALVASEKKYRQIFENASEGIFQMTMDGTLVTQNPAMEQIIKTISPGENHPTHINFFEFFFSNPEHKQQFQTQLTRNLHIKYFETTISPPKGDPMHFCIGAYTIQNPIKGQAHYQGRIEDITEKKKIEQLAIAKEKAESATEMKSAFLANMSHEIRTPMNAILGFTDLTLRTNLSIRQKDYLNKIHFSSKNLLGIINDILDFSKIEAGHLSLESTEFKLEEVLGHLSNMLITKAENKQLELLFNVADDVPLTLNGDPLRLGQILINITNNAIKFTDTGEVVISISKEKIENNTVTLKFSIKDTGIGLTPDQIEKIFNPFSQADSSTTRKFGGTGLGLSISRNLIQLMNGDIHIESEIGKGSNFIFTIQLGYVDKEKDLSRIIPQDIKGLKALVVDDVSTSREILSTVLKSFSFEVAVAASASEAIEKLETANDTIPYDLVLMDYKMPNTDGIQAAKMIKQNKNLSKSPIILMVTAYGHDLIREQAIKIGMDGFLIKPINRSILFDTILKAIGKMPLLKHAQSQIQSDEHKPRSMQWQLYKNSRILLVEDNEINQELAKELLTQFNLHVTTAENGQEALETIEHSAIFDLIFMDIQMPVMDGYEATKNIRKNPLYKNVPIIAMTAHALKGDRENCIAKGMDDHLAKPVDPDQLAKCLEKWLKPKTESSVHSQVSENALPSAEPEHKDVDLPDMIPGLDLVSGLKRLRGNKSVYYKLLSKVKSRYAIVLSEIEQAWSLKDSDAIYQKAHMIKGMAGNIGAHDLFRSAKNLEDNAKQKKLNGLEKTLSQFRDDFNQVINSIDSIMHKNDFHGQGSSSTLSLPKNPDLKVLSPLITELSQHLESGHSKSKIILSELSALFSGHPFEEELIQLSNNVDDYDFDEAFQDLISFCKKINFQLDQEKNAN